MPGQASSSKIGVAAVLIVAAVALAAWQLWPRAKAPVTQDTFRCPKCGHLYAGKPPERKSFEDITAKPTRPPCPKCGAVADTAALIRCVKCSHERVVTFPANAPRGVPLRVPPCPKCAAGEFVIIRRGDPAELAKLPVEQATPSEQ